MKRKLTNKQKMFCKEYLVDLNASQAALRAGYSKRNHDKIGHQLIEKTRIKAKIQEEMNKRGRRIEITADKVLQEIARLALSNMQDYVIVDEKGFAYVDLSKLTREQAAAIQEIHTDEVLEDDYEHLDAKGKPTKRTVRKIKFKLSDKSKNLELLGKHLKLFTDVIEHQLPKITEEKINERRHRLAEYYSTN